MNNPRFKMMLPWKAPFLGHFPPCPQNQRVREVQTCHRPINHWSVAQSRLAAGIAEFRTGTGFQRPSQRTPDFLLPSSISKTSTVQSLVNNITNKTSKKGTKAKYVGIDGSRQTWNITPSSTKRSDYTSNCIPISMSSGAAGPSGSGPEKQRLSIFSWISSTCTLVFAVQKGCLRYWSKLRLLHFYQVIKHGWEIPYKWKFQMENSFINEGRMVESWNFVIALACSVGPCSTFHDCTHTTFGT